MCQQHQELFADIVISAAAAGTAPAANANALRLAIAAEVGPADTNGVQPDSTL